MACSLNSMNYTAKDISLFIFTYNRPDMSRQALESLLSQNEQSPIYVFDNSDNNETEQIVRRYPRVTYFRTPAGIPFANFIAAQKQMSTPYTMVLHDDDLIHPAFISLAIKALNQYEDISFISSKTTIFYSKDTPAEYTRALPLDTRHYLIEDQADFALSFWAEASGSWSGSVIRSDLYKKVDVNALALQYGKISDWPMLIEIMSHGKAVIFTDKRCMFYRRHKGQDSVCDNTGISMDNLLNWLCLFKSFAKTKKLCGVFILYGLLRTQWIIIRFILHGSCGQNTLSGN